MRDKILLYSCNSLIRFFGSEFYRFLVLYACFVLIYICFNALVLGSISFIMWDFVIPSSLTILIIIRIGIIFSVIPTIYWFNETRDRSNDISINELLNKTED